MENFIDDNEAYARLVPPCGCGCFHHCGFRCRTDGCGCETCTCPRCQEQDLLTMSLGATIR